MEMEMEEQGGPSGTADSLHSDIAAAFDAGEKSETAAPEKTPDVSEAARTLAGARAGKPAAEAAPDATKTAPAAIPEAGKAPEVKDGAAPVVEPVEAPSHWPAADREMFAKAAPEYRTWLLSRHKAMEADYTRKTQELGSVRQLKAELDEVFAPYRQQMALSGISDGQAIKQLVAAHAYLQKDPVAAIKHLAGQYGIDLNAVINATAQPGAEALQNPVFQQLQQTVAELQGKLNSQLTAQTQHEQNARLNEVTQFAEEKDVQGNLLRPYFNDVARDITILLHGAKQAGEPITLQDAYDRAVYANPQTRQQMLATFQVEQRKKDEAERAAKADAARKAGFDVKGEGAAAPVVATTDSLRGDLLAAFDAGGGRV